MKQTESLKKNQDFRKIYHTGKSYANKYLVMYVLENDLNKNRLGISVSKKVGNSVIRHRITRLIRESYRLSEDKILKGFDLVVVARVGAKDKSFHEIESALLHLIRLHKIENKRANSEQIESGMVEV
ncbi:MAG: ribonuclease P protein component [Clostridiales bacterium]|jgi:ribonuclease P protein component|nr:ribonuclease P protein component [Clostridiales bacterium]